MRSILIALGLALLAVSAFAQPKLVIANAEYEFGTVPQNATAVNYFWFKSTGKDSVKIVQIKTGCDCVTMPLPRSTMAPGDSMLVGFFWETQHKIGQSSRYPYIYVDGVIDPVRMTMKSVVADVPDSTRPLLVKPYRAEMSRMPGTSIDSVVLNFTNFGTSPMAFTVVSTVPKEYTYTLPDTVAAGATAKGVVRVHPSMLDKEFKSSMTIEWKTTDGQTGRYTIPVRRKLFG